MATTRKLCYPHPAGLPGIYISGGVPGGLHITEGIPENWALDFMAHGGTPIFAVEAGVITKLSGHTPSSGVHQGDIFGWNVYLETPDKLEYFYTHIGKRIVSVGERVKKGQVIAYVGHWPGNEARSHTHLGLTFTLDNPRTLPAKRGVQNVAKAPHLKEAA